MYSDCLKQNIVSRHQNLHEKCYLLPTSLSTGNKHSFLPWIISEWNEEEEEVYFVSTVSAENLNILKDRLQNHLF